MPEYVIEHNALPSDIVDGNYDSTQGLVAVNSVVEQNKGKALKFFVGTQAEYDAYAGDKTNLFAVISDDTTKQSIIDTLSQHTKSINGIIDGSISVNKINGVEITKDENGVLRVGDTIIPQRKLLFDGENGLDGIVDLSSPISSGDTLEIQACLAASSETDMIRKFRVGRIGEELGVISDVVLVNIVDDDEGSNYSCAFQVKQMTINVVNTTRLQIADNKACYVHMNNSGIESIGCFNGIIRIRRVLKVIE